ncbi:hypothetical protein AtEden1_Chr4g0279181 [Arabidopsis thaliana]
MVAVFSPDSLKLIRLDRSRDFVFWSSLDNVYNFLFFWKCVKEKNPYALYVRRLVSVFLFLDIEEAIMVVTNVKEV